MNTRKTLVALWLVVIVACESPCVFAAAVQVYWIDKGVTLDKIQRANIDGTGIQDLVTSECALSIALDIGGGKMYWTNADEIRRANLDGSGVETLVTASRWNYFGIALDVDAGKMYFTHHHNDTIQRANLDGSHVETVMTTGRYPASIALDVPGRKIYWTDSRDGGRRIRRANLDGSNLEDVIYSLSPQQIALDTAGGKIYWPNRASGEINRADLEGSNREVLQWGQGTPEGLALDLDQGKLYWTTGWHGEIRRANLDGSNVEDLITGLSGPRALALSPVPEPSTLLLLSMGAVGLLAYAWRKRRRR